MTSLLFFRKCMLLVLCVFYSVNSHRVMASDSIHKGYSDTAPQYEVDGVVVSNIDVKAKLWNPRGKSKAQLLERSLFLASEYDLKRTQTQKERAQQAREKYRDAIYINSLMIGSVGEIMLTEEQFITAIKRNHEAGASGVSPTAYAFPSDGPMPLLERLEKSKKILDTLDYAVLGTNVDSIIKAKKEGKIAVFFNTQGADYAEADLSQLDEAHKRGLRTSNLIYNNINGFAAGGSHQGKGLTKKGQTFIARANKIGVTMDCSHSSDQTCIEVAQLTQKPMLATHSNPAALKAMGRNMSDEAMKAIGSTNGAICSVGVGLFMNEEGDSSPERLVEQINYTANLIGKDKTCYATDYMHNANDFFKRSLADVKVFPPEKGYGQPATNIGTEHVWDVVAILEDNYGWTETEIKGFLGENLLRVYEENWVN